ncbi:hypothetical protein ACRAWB_01800 [Leifsonia poae]|uniref:hypothetical protein n=1 Tax=Leifsonia poae TaxID=110933 RepID=UPI003D68B6EC
MDALRTAQERRELREQRADALVRRLRLHHRSRVRVGRRRVQRADLEAHPERRPRLHREERSAAVRSQRVLASLYARHRVEHMLQRQHRDRIRHGDASERRPRDDEVRHREALVDRRRRDLRGDHPAQAEAGEAHRLAGTHARQAERFDRRARHGGPFVTADHEVGRQVVRRRARTRVPRPRARELGDPASPVRCVHLHEPNEGGVGTVVEVRVAEVVDLPLAEQHLPQRPDRAPPHRARGDARLAQGVGGGSERQAEEPRRHVGQARGRRVVVTARGVVPPVEHILDQREGPREEVVIRHDHGVLAVAEETAAVSETDDLAQERGQREHRDVWARPPPGEEDADERDEQRHGRQQPTREPRDSADGTRGQRQVEPAQRDPPGTARHRRGRAERIRDGLLPLNPEPHPRRRDADQPPDQRDDTGHHAEDQQQDSESEHDRDGDDETEEERQTAAGRAPPPQLRGRLRRHAASLDRGLRHPFGFDAYA